MLDELTTLFGQVEADAPPAAYQAAVREHNCLGKRSGRTRQLTARHLAELYGLDPVNPVHAGLRFFWSRDEAARPQLALLAAIARDSLLRDTIPVVLVKSLGESVSRQWLEERIEVLWPERFSPATRKSAAQNINSSLTKSGHLEGRVNKIRTQLQPATGAVAYALYLAWLQGGRGELLLQSLYCRVLDVGSDRLLELATQASARGWMVMRRVDNVVDVDYPVLAPVVARAIQAGKDAALDRELPHEQS
ncbi:hypothetical protein U0O11_06150 [Cobetia sp. D5]|uniref:hypothetical protein n=1 Tax=Cobetia sp. D5 TaxID=3105867 RepID=UPI002D795D87|nr:hypothetical protein [Cobetia sp. D5]